MKDFGVPSAFESLKRVLMHRPGIELRRVTSNTLEEFHFQRPVDEERFIKEYEGMMQLFIDHGAEVLLLREILSKDADSLHYLDQRPNMTYTRDLATVFRNGAVLMGPYLKGRWGDQEMMGRAFRKLGIPILGAIEPPGFLEGGGVTIIGDDTIVASLCDRANQEGTKQLRDLVLGKEAKYFLEVPLPFGNIHIDGIFMVLDERLCIIHERSFEAFPCRLFTAGKSDFSHVMFPEFLEQRGFKCIAISNEERRAGHLNVVVTRRSKDAVGFQTARRVAAEMHRYGWELSTFPADELVRGNGGPHCMTCPLLVE